ncbi:MAG: ABC transporter ATP-binding protein [Gemmatimonadota bacterium]
MASRTAAMVVLLILAGLAEGVGVATLLPVLEVVAGGGAGGGGVPGESIFSRIAGGALGVVGLPPTLPALLGLITFAIAAKAGFRWLAMRQVALTVAHVAGDLRRRLLRAIMAARWRHFATRPTGEFATALSLEAFQASYAFRRACDTLAAVIQIVVYVAVAMMISWQVAGLALAAGVLIAAILGRFVRASRRIGHEYSGAHRQVAGRAADVIQGLKAIKAMGRERGHLELLEEHAMTLSRTESRIVIAEEGLRASHEPILTVFIAAGLYAAVTIGGQPLSVLVILVFLFHRVVTRFRTVQAHYQGMASLEATYWTFRSRIDAARAEAEPPSGDAEPPPVEDGIRFDGVRFSYDGDRGDEVLRGVDLVVPAGRFVAVVGRSGAGKTTLIDLLLGLHRPDRGRILVDGAPLSSIDLGRWRRTIGYIPQETLLLHDTIARNVGLGEDDGIDDARVEAALRDAGAWEFVSRLPEGPDTVVGERGARLSGGERQRIAIARALAHRPRLLILDEATAGLDGSNEAAILRTLRALLPRVTIIAASHHVAVADAADRVYTLRNGSAHPAEAAVAT